MQDHLIENVKAYLIAQGVVRDPDTANPNLHPLWMDPQDGVPAPGEGDAPYADPTLVASIGLATGVPPRPFEGFIRNSGIEFVVRSVDPKEAVNFEDSVRTVLNDKRGWTMALLLVNESMLIRDLQPVTSGPQGYTFTFEYMFSLWK